VWEEGQQCVTLICRGVPAAAAAACHAVHGWSFAWPFEHSAEYSNARLLALLAQFTRVHHQACI
jgi:hypothetical protein